MVCKKHIGMTECHISFSGHCDLDLGPKFRNYCVRSISLIFFEVEIFQIRCVNASWDGRESHPFSGHCDLDL